MIMNFIIIIIIILLLLFFHNYSFIIIIIIILWLLLLWLKGINKINKYVKKKKKFNYLQFYMHK